MVEINNQTFNEGDSVRFERATLPQNRERDYQITAVTPNGINVSAAGFDYQYNLAEAARLGITHITDHNNES
ncbi:hypothetical protein [Streptomyces noursei]|uniref:hypothetical protein n=1 Tax=Streptomyces noursei TaxID=1971 RepID=UPI001673FED4|nr:hypothetical protein [Streptomyces noursei]MCZ1019809.1 hypothetical protein [Streptomyces noursei]GGX36486.1 hypothetical protein GCM10010341_67570 [Streptomyces noursei]